MLELRPKLQTQYLFQLTLKRPLAKRSNNLRNKKRKEASREEIKSTATPFAEGKAQQIFPLSAETRQQIDQTHPGSLGAEKLHPSPINLGVHGAPRMDEPTIIPQSTVLCSRTPVLMTNGRSSTNTRYVTAALPKAITGNTAQIKSRKAAQTVETHIIQTLDAFLSGKRQHMPMLVDNLALNVSPAFRETRYSLIPLAERALYSSAIQSLLAPLKDSPSLMTIPQPL